MKIHIELNEHTLRSLVTDYLSELMGGIPLKEEDIEIQVKSKQNYKSEWERAEFKATVDKVL